ncbi:FG-GAP-like repeat-containing protein, partial [Parachitinimonas caeni]
DGLRTGQLDAEGYLTEYQYDGAGRKIETIRYATQIKGATDSSTLESLRSQLPIDAQTQARYTATDQRTSYYYDKRGLLVGELDAEGYLTTYDYDSRGNKTDVSRYEVAQQTPGAAQIDRATNLRTRLAQDAQGKITVAVTATKRTHSFVYNSLNQLQSETSPEGLVTTYTYDALGNVISKTVGTTGLNNSRQSDNTQTAAGQISQALGRAQGGIELAPLYGARLYDVSWAPGSRGDLIEIGVDAQGRRVARQWKATEQGYIAGQDVTLGRNQTDVTYQFADLNGDGVSDLTEIRRRWDGKAVATNWLVDAQTGRFTRIQAAGPDVPPNAIINGSFELAGVGDFVYRPGIDGPSLPGWTFTGTAGVATNDGSFTRGAPPAPSGNSVAFLQRDGKLSQSVSAASGSVLTFQASQRVNQGSGDQSLQLRVNGVAVGNAITPPRGSWASYTFTLTFTGNGPHQIELVGTRGDSDVTALIDQIQLIDPATAVGQEIVVGDWAAGNGYLVGDMTGDGKADLIAVDNPENGNGMQARLYKGDGLGGFSHVSSLNFTTGAKGRTYGLADLNRDGRLEMVSLVQRNGYFYQDTIFIGSDGNLSYRGDYTSQSRNAVAQYLASDIDGNGKLDWSPVFRGSDGYDHLWAALQRGDGIWDWGKEAVLGTPKDQVRYYSPDLNGDGLGDLVQYWRNAQGQAVVTLYRGTGSGDYRQTSETVLGPWVDGADLHFVDRNGDGRPDLVMTSSQNGVARIDAWLFDGRQFLQSTPWVADSLLLQTDFNADGKQDLFEVRHDASGDVSIRQWLATDTGYVEGIAGKLGRWQADQQYLVGDLDGSGRAGLVQIRKREDGQTVATRWTVDASGQVHTREDVLGGWSSGAWYQLGDGTGDGRADLWQFAERPNGMRLTVFRNSADGFTTPQSTDWDGRFGGAQFGLQDVNGDGKLEAAVAYAYGTTRYFLTVRFNSDGSLARSYMSADNWRDVQYLLGDFDGSGRQDVAEIYTGADGLARLKTWLGRADSNYVAGSEMTLGSADRPDARYLVGDLDGDGKSDVLQIWRNPAGHAIASRWLSRGDRFEAAGDTDLGTWNPQAVYRLLDQNGDHRSDLVIVLDQADGSQQIQPWLNDGAHFSQKGHWGRDSRFLDADLNGDGQWDLLEISHSQDGKAYLRQWLASGAGYTPGASALLDGWQADSQYLIGDLDGDGKTELVEIRQRADGMAVARSIGGNLQILAETELGRWQANSRYVLGDADGDRKVDLWQVSDLGNGYARASLWQNQGEGRFKQTRQDDWQATLSQMQIGAQDINADGRAELIISYAYGTSRYFRSLRLDPNGSLYAAAVSADNWRDVPYLGGDFDGNGLGDIAEITRGSDNLDHFKTWLGRQSWDYVAGSDTNLGRLNAQYLSGDLDGDGRSELVQVWQNEVGQAVATPWQRQADGSLQRGQDSVLGEWREGLTFRLSDQNGDHRADLIAIWPETNGRHSIAAWRHVEGQFVQSGDFSRDTRFLDVDLNGDGRRDLLEIRHDSEGNAVARAWTSTGNGYAIGASTTLGPWAADSQYLVADLDGDGQSDLVQIRRRPDGQAVASRWLQRGGSLSQGSETELGRWDASNRYALGDVTGDGKADLWVISKQPNQPLRLRISLWQGSDSGFSAGPVSDPGVDLTDLAIRCQDIDGDGKQELLLSFRSGYRYFWSCTLDSNGNLSLIGHNSLPWQDGQFLDGDFNADGRMDLGEINRGSDGLDHFKQWQGRPDRYYNSAINDQALGQTGATYLSGDLSGDGRTDLLQLWRNSAGQTVATVWTAGAKGLERGADTLLGAWNPAARYQLADQDGDGRADLIVTTRQANGQHTLQSYRFDGSGLVQQGDFRRDTRFLDIDFDADGKQDLLEIRHDANGDAIARQWTSTGNGYVEGVSSHLGRWQADSQFLVGDLDGDGKPDLAEIRRRPDGQAEVRLWIPSAQGLTLQSTTLLGRWNPGNRYLLGDANGDRKVELFEVSMGWDKDYGESTWVSVRGHDGSGLNRLLDRVRLGGRVAEQAQLSLAPLNASDRMTLLISPAPGNRNSVAYSLWLNEQGQLKASGFGIDSQDRQTTLLGDINGDASADWLSFHQTADNRLSLKTWLGWDRSNGYFVSVSEQDFGVARPQSVFLTGPVRSTGKADLVEIAKNAEGQAVATLWSATGTTYQKISESPLGPWQEKAQYRLIDQDGDGRLDLLATWTEPDGRQSLASWRSDGQQFIQRGDWRKDTRFLQGDFNGDGREDLLEIRHDGNGDAVAVQWQAGAGGFSQGATVTLGPWRADNHYLTGRLQGDARTGLVVIRQRTDGMAVAQNWQLAPGGDWQAQGETVLGPWSPRTRYQLVDANNDGRADLFELKLGIDPNYGASTWISLRLGNGQDFKQVQDTLRLGHHVDSRSSLEVGRTIGMSRPALLVTSPWWQGNYTIACVLNDQQKLEVNGRGTQRPQIQDFLLADASGDDRTDRLTISQTSDGTTRVDIDPWDYRYGNVWDQGLDLGAAKPQARFLSGHLDSDRKADLLQIWRNEAGQAVARLWHSTGTSYQQGRDSILGAWHDDARYRLLDQDGDGRQDLVATWAEADGSQTLTTWRPMDGQFVQQGNWGQDARFLEANLDGNGRRDFLEIVHAANGEVVARSWLNNGSGLVEGSATPLGRFQLDNQYLVADLNGDGRSDLLELARRSDGQMLARQWINLDGQLVRQSETVLGPWGVDRKYRLGDANGDGRADLWLLRDVDGSQMELTLWQNGSEGFQAGPSKRWDGSFNGAQLVVQDVDGDRRQDVSVIYWSGYYWQRHFWLETDGQTLGGTVKDIGWGREALTTLSADINGDGRSDTVELYRAGDGTDQLAVWLGDLKHETGSSGIGPNLGQKNARYAVGDLDQDGKADLVQVWRNAQDQAVATIWRSGGNVMTKGQDIVLGAWEERASYRLLDTQGDGRLQLLAILPQANGSQRIQRWDYRDSQFVPATDLLQTATPADMHTQAVSGRSAGVLSLGTQSASGPSAYSLAPAQTPETPALVITSVGLSPLSPLAKPNKAFDLNQQLDSGSALTLRQSYYQYDSRGRLIAEISGEPSKAIADASKKLAELRKPFLNGARTATEADTKAIATAQAEL